MLLLALGRCKPATPATTSLVYSILLSVLSQSDIGKNEFSVVILTGWLQHGLGCGLHELDTTEDFKINNTQQSTRLWLVLGEGEIFGPAWYTIKELQTLQGMP